VRAILLPIRDIRRGGVGQPAEPFRPQRAGRETFVEMRDKLHNALLKLELRVQDVARREQRNAYLEHELKLQGQHHTNTLKEVVMLKRKLAQ
jgi:hypothetical protein